LWLQVAERGYHIGRQLDGQAQQLQQQAQQLAAAAAEGAGLRARLQEAQGQQALLLQRVSDAFVSGAQVSCALAESCKMQVGLVSADVLA
jgi:hypothetical protein